MDQLSKKNIDSIVFEVLRKSRSLDVFPTPVDKIIQYCELRLDSKNIFNEVPHNYVAKNIDAFKRMMKKVLGALHREEKTIYIDPALPGTKRNFVKLHEVGHDVIPWQSEIKYVDDEYTLSLEVKEQFEAEANYFASAGLFQLDRFEDDVKTLPLEIGSPMALAKKFGGSNHAAIRRYVECSNKRCALIVLETKGTSNDRSSLNLRNSFQSKAFSKDFGEITWPMVLDITFPFISDYSKGKKFHKDGIIALLTINGFVNFEYHYFNNRYNVFVLIIPIGEKIKTKTKIHINSLI